MANLQAESLREIETRLRQHLSVQRWLKDKSPRTVGLYVGKMNHFCQRSGMNPDQFLEWAKTVQPTEVQETIDKFAEDLSEGQAFNFKIDMRSFLRHQGFNDLPKSKITYNLQDWHREYKHEEAKKLLSYLDSPIHKMYVYFAAETGFRARTILDLKYGHVKEDFESDVVPCAVRLEPKYHTGKKAAGFSFLGQRSVDMLRESIKFGLVKAQPDSPIFPIGYDGIYNALDNARKKAGINPKIQPNHGLRKMFESGLDASGIDHELKMMIEGHFGGSRARHYTGREWDDLRPVYAAAYPHLDLEGSNPELEAKLANWQSEKTELERENRKLKGLLSDAEQKFDREIRLLREYVDQRTAGHKKRT